MASAYRVQIVNGHGQIVWSTVPGLIAEVTLVDNLIARVTAKGVGLGRTSAHVAADIRAAFAELLFDLKTGVPPPQHGDIP